MKWTLVMLGVLAVLALAVAQQDEDEDSFEAWDDALDTSDVDDSDDSDALVRVVRAARAGGRGGTRKANKNACRYTKGPWSECDTSSNQRSRTLTLKKGDSTCEATKTITKRCKKVCHYARGSWTGCAHSQQIRTDLLLPDSDGTCQATRQIVRRCQDSDDPALAARNSSTGEVELPSPKTKGRQDPHPEDVEEKLIDFDDIDESSTKNGSRVKPAVKTPGEEMLSTATGKSNNPDREKETTLTRSNDRPIPRSQDAEHSETPLESVRSV